MWLYYWFDVSSPKPAELPHNITVAMIKWFGFSGTAGNFFIACRMKSGGFLHLRDIAHGITIKNEKATVMKHILILGNAVIFCVITLAIMTVDTVLDKSDFFFHFSLFLWYAMFYSSNFIFEDRLRDLPRFPCTQNWFSVVRSSWLDYLGIHPYWSTNEPQSGNHTIKNHLATKGFL